MQRALDLNLNVCFWVRVVAILSEIVIKMSEIYYYKEKNTSAKTINLSSAAFKLSVSVDAYHKSTISKGK